MLKLCLGEAGELWVGSDENLKHLLTRCCEYVKLESSKSHVCAELLLVHLHSSASSSFGWCFVGVLVLPVFFIPLE